MKFDYCISNPAFNISEDGNIAGTGGNTTLYKTATRNDFDNILKDNGVIVNITLKGIIPDLIAGHFKNYQINFIHLMDNVDFWSYNTCFFSITKSQRIDPPNIVGGMAAKIYSYDPTECFDFTYYSGSNNGMDHQFGDCKKNKVIRQLPSRNEGIRYDYTDKNISSGWKFAFSVLESKKSYTVTNEPIYGGTICYVSTQTESDANKLKLFVENNDVFSKYVSRMKIKGLSFGLRNIRKFDLRQIITGKEIPTEWRITATDLEPPQHFASSNNTNEIRVKKIGEVFTPTELVNYILNMCEKLNIVQFDNTKTFIDSMCGNGQFLFEILSRKLKHGIDFETALTTIYGVDLMPDNVELCRERLLCGQEHLRHIVVKNIVCHDALTYDYSFNGTNFTDKELALQRLGVDIPEKKPKKVVEAKKKATIIETNFFMEEAND